MFNFKILYVFFSRFPTDENIKRKWVLAVKRRDVNAAGIWEPKKGDVLCSRHFKKTDFDRSAPNIKLKPGVIPSIFDSISRLQVCLSDPAYHHYSLFMDYLRTFTTLAAIFYCLLINLKTILLSFFKICKLLCKLL